MSERFELNDELLCAYMDGELDAGTRTRVEQALVGDAGARVRLERMRVADARLKADVPLPAPQPGDALSQHIMDGKPMSRASRSPRGWGAAVSALAAGIAGLAVGFVLSRPREPVEIPVAASETTSLSGAPSSGLLLAALESGESGRAASEGDRSVWIILTFRAEDGRYCRAFGSRNASSAAEGVACRSDAKWEVVAWDGTADPSEGFRAAGSSELLDEVMDRLGGGGAVEVADERELIERRWAAAPQR